MATTPTRFEPPPSDRWEPQDERMAGAQAGLGSFWAVVVHNRLLILACTVAVTGAVAFYTARQTPVFEAATSLRIRAREPNLPDIYRTISTGAADIEMATEIAVLESRALKEDAAAVLGLQVDAVAPVRVARGQLVRRVSVSPDAPLGTYRLTRGPDGRFGVFVSDSVTPAYLSGPDGWVHVPGATFLLGPAASRYQELQVSVSSMSAAVARLGAVDVQQLSRDANILTLSYRDTDSLLAADVPNVIAARYMARRQEIEKAEAGSAARFLREQLSRISAELGSAEETFRQFRERARVLDPQVETSAEVSRLISKESERSSLEAERQALSKSLAEIETARARPGGSSPYPKLSGLPFLLRNEATSALLSALITAENERAAMISATPEDPDMRVVTAKINDLEVQLRSIIQTYVHGLENQVNSLDATLADYGTQLSAIPRKQLEYARLDRNVKGLESVYTLLQTRLNEAEIAQAVKDASMSVVDSAVTPSSPSSPKPVLNLAAGIAVGLLLGLGLACIREYRDGSVHSRRDVLIATGVPVLGLIPRIPKAQGRIALITGKRRLRSSAALAPAPAPTPREIGNGRPQRSYTFLAEQPQPYEAEPVEAEPLRPVPSAPRQLPAAELELTVSRWTNIVAEAYSLLLTNITFARTSPPTKVVAITSPLAEDGKTTCAVNLAITLALRRTRVLLVDADLRRGVVHTSLGADRSPGLTEVLVRGLPEADAIRSIKVGEHGGLLHFLPTGGVPPNPSALLESPAFRTLLERLREDYDTIILDSPPVNVISDASILGLNADAVLMVARSGVTQASALMYAVEQLNRVGVPPLGVVLNDIDFKREAIYDASYRSYTANQYVSAGPES